jgi:DMSO/TMAO reductase YedYZ molybdopterin-dependent catalytic subunit
MGFALIPLVGCEVNSFEPLVDGTSIPFLTPLTAPTPEQEFYAQFGGQATITDWPGVPQLTRASWEMRIDGLVDQPLTITFEDIEQEASRAVRVINTLRCIVDENFIPGLIGTTVWTGIPLRIFLDRAGVDPLSTQRLRLYGQDGFTNNLKLNQIYGPQAPDLIEPLLVYEMNNEPLTPDHGRPVRLLVPGYYGYKSIKWLVRIEASGIDEAFGSYQDELNYSDDGAMPVSNKVTNPLQSQTIEAGAFQLFGYALSGRGGIHRVEFSVDGGAYTPARILPLSEVVATNPALRSAIQLQDSERFFYPFRSVWALWEATWNATPGSHTLRVRAFDQKGNGQPLTDEDDLDGTNPEFVLRVNVT